MSGELKQLAQFVYDFCLEQVPVEVVQAARFCVLDTIGSALGSCHSKEIQRIGETYGEWTGSGSNRCTSAAWAKGYRTGLLQAILINGCMSHELELDDVHTASKSHPGAVIVPAAWSTADAIGADGKKFLEAVIVGYEVMGRIGQTMDVASNRRRGWHTTGIIGTFGAAAAAAKLWNLTPEQILSAFGIAGTQSSGLWAFLAEGATCKKLHPARAAVNGVEACLLAKSGMSGPEHILDAEDGGFYQAVSDGFDMSRLCLNLGTSYVVNAIDKKPYPCCRTTHHAIDAALNLREKQGIKAEDIVSVLVETYDVGVLQCGFSKYPESGVEAKFSIPYTSAVAFVYGKVTVEEFTDAVIRDPLVIRIAKHTEVKADSMFSKRYPKRWGSRMTVNLKNGEQKICQIDDMSGSVAVPLSITQETDKFKGLASQAYGSEKVKQLQEEILRVEVLKRLPDLA